MNSLVVAYKSFKERKIWGFYYMQRIIPEKITDEVPQIFSGSFPAG